MRINDAIAGALLLVFGLAVIVLAMQLPDMPGQPYGAASFPVLIGAGFVLVSLALIAQGIVEWRHLPGIVASEWGRSPWAWFRIALTVLVVVLYIAFSARLGFAVSSFLVLLVLFFAMRVRPIPAIAAAVLATLAIQQAFGVLLRVPLPRNALFAFLW
jgi:putative tricarboxylic transport membrane protein